MEPLSIAGKKRGSQGDKLTRKTIKGERGEIPLDTPRDRQGTFEPQVIAKHPRRLAGFDEKILALYA